MKIGIIGAGQLARMLALAAHPLGISCHCTANSTTDSASGVAKLHPIDLYDNDALEKFATLVDVISFENENVDPLLLDKIAQLNKVIAPNINAIKVSQDRLIEKSTVNQLGIATAKFKAVNHIDELKQATQSLGLPCILKTRRLGYDGKGQYMIRQAQDIETAWQQLSGQECIVEQFVDFNREVSLIAVRSANGDIAYYPLAENKHQNGILRESIVPYKNSMLQQQAEKYAKCLLDYFDYVGVLAIEFFIKDNHLLINELAPRVHNSGHWTIEGAETSQFENHVRAIAGLPLGCTHATHKTVMINCIGNMPQLSEILALPGAHYHSYNKSPRPGRKLGHITVTQTENTPLDKLRQLMSN